MLARLLGGISFCLGLVLVVVGGAELFTGNALLVIACAFAGRADAQNSQPLIPSVLPVAADARRFLRRAGPRYDFIVGDVYDGVRSIPPHLVTREFFCTKFASIDGRFVCCFASLLFQFSQERLE